MLLNDTEILIGKRTNLSNDITLVSENKVLCHPASVDSLTTSAGTEDHVSMGGFSARKCLRVIEHVEQGICQVTFWMSSFMLLNGIVEC